MIKTWVANIAIASAVLLNISGPAAAETYPDHPISLVLGFAAGGPTDVVARILANDLGKELGQAVVVENRVGADGLVALNWVKRSKPDGYTLMFGSSGALTMQPAYKKSVDYDVLRDFTPISLTASFPYLLSVSASSPYHTLNDLLNAARQKTLTFASAGNGSANHLAAEWLMSAKTLKLTHIPYKGDAPALVEVLSGRVDMGFFSGVTVKSHIDTGKLRALAVSSDKPLPAHPEVPTIAQAAGIPGFSVEAWNGVLAPAGLPKDRLTKLNAAINKVMNSAEVREKLENLGQNSIASTPEQFSKYIASETEKWEKIIHDAGVERVD